MYKLWEDLKETAGLFVLILAVGIAISTSIGCILAIPVLLIKLLIG